MEKASESPKQCQDASAPKCPHFKSLSLYEFYDKSATQNYSAEEAIISSKSGNHISEIAFPNSFESLSNLNVNESLYKPEVLKSNEEHLTFLKKCQDLETNEILSETYNGTKERGSLVKPKNVDSYQTTSTDSKSSHRNHIESFKKEESCKLRKYKKAKRREDADMPSQTKVSNILALIANPRTRDGGLFYSLQEISPHKSGSTNSRLRSSESTGKPKFDSVKKSNPSLLDRTPRCSESNRKSKSSKSSPSRKKPKSPETPEISHMLRALEDMKLSEATIVNRTILSESTGSEIQPVFSNDSKDKIELYFDLFKHDRTSSSSRGSSDSGTLTPGSDDLETTSKPSESKSTDQCGKSKLVKTVRRSIRSDQFVRSKLLDQSVRTMPPDLSVKSKLPDLSVKSKLSDLSAKSKLSDQSGKSKLTNPSVSSKLSDQSAKSKIIDQSVKSKIVDQSIKLKLPDPSVRPKQFEESAKPKVPDQSKLSKRCNQSVRPKLSNVSASSEFCDASVRKDLHDPSVRSKLSKRSLKSNLSDFSLKSKLAIPYDENGEASVLNQNAGSRQAINDLRLKKFVMSRQPHFLEVRENAERVKTFMDQAAKIKQEFRYDTKLPNIRQTKGASDWLKLHYYWDLVLQEVNMIIETIDVLYDSDENNLMTGKEFHSFMQRILCVFRDIMELICMSQNGNAKYAKFCSSQDMFLFLNYLNTFESIISSLIEKLRIEREQFSFFKKSGNNWGSYLW